MFQRSAQTFLSYYLVCVIAFEDILHAYGEDMIDMSDKGKIQYQLLQQRGDLPQYGDCWKSAVRHVDDGCRRLSEETQSEIALHLTNCFLGMSGHETYSCETDRKPNLRGICISTMSDRAFNVYTEFYTHTQNMCFFLRGQIWHETIAENTARLGRQLRESARNQEKLLEIQRESIELQRSMREFFEYLSEKHKDFDVLSANFKELQSWLLGEINWLDSFIFYFITSTMIMFFTSLKRTSEARFFMLVTITLNVIIERLLGFIISYRITSIFDSYKKYYDLVWFSRYITLIVLCSLLLYKFFAYKNYLVDNNSLLERVYEKLTILGNKIELCSLNNSNISIVSERTPNTICDIIYNKSNGAYKNVNCDLQTPKSAAARTHVKRENNIKCFEKTQMNMVTPKINNEVRYNLRNRSATPEVIQKFV